MDHRAFDDTPANQPLSERRAPVAAALTFVLAAFQAWIVSRLRRSGDMCVESPTGSGKTLMIRTLVGLDLALPGGFSHAIVASPQEQIERGFLSETDVRVEWPAGAAAQPALTIPTRLFRAARRDGCGTRRSIRRYLAASERAYALACTHAALCTLQAKDLPADLTGRVLIIDESHHVPARGLSRIARWWRARGGRLLCFSATPFRTDGKAVVLEDMKHIRRSLPEHMEEGFAPRVLTSEIVALGRSSQHVTVSQFTGDRAPPSSYTAVTIQAVVNKWIEDGRPRVIIRVPRGRGPLVRGIVEALTRAGARVLDATGTARTRKLQFLRALDAERGRTVETSSIDVIVGIARVCEGTDWPICSAVYSIGIPGSLQLVAQLAGRALRRKAVDYPAPYRDTARMVFFVPTAEGEALAALSLDHSRHALLVAAFLADHAVGQAWIVTAAVQRGLRSAMAGQPDEERDDALDETYATDDPGLRSEAQLAIAAACEELMESGQPMTVETVLEHVSSVRTDIPVQVVERVTVELLATLPTTAGSQVQEQLEKEIAARVRIDPQVQAAMREAFGVILTDFRQTTLEASPVLAHVRQQVHALTGGAMRAFADRLAAAVPRPLTEAIVLAWADTEHAATGAWPSAISGDVRGQPGETWGAADRALRVGARGLPGGGSLAQLLETHRGAPNHLAPRRVTRAMIARWARDYYAANGCWPTRASGPISGTPFTWCGINNALVKGIHGLKGGTTLARFLETLGARNISRLIRLSDELVAGWAHAFRAVHARWPNPSKDGQIVGAPAGETWVRIEAAMVHGLRGMRPRTSLAAFLHEVCGAPPPGRVRRELTLEFVLTMACAFLARTGRWPNAASVDPELEKTGETWHRIDRALRIGGRGLPKTTLLRLYADYLASQDGGTKSA